MEILIGASHLSEFSIGQKLISTMVDSTKDGLEVFSRWSIAIEDEEVN
jgi:hypothetical protein